MDRIIIIGAGISGLTAAHMFKTTNEVVVLEGANRPGGLIKCDRINGNLFHRTGGHVFNTKRKDVSEWFWQFFDKEKEFVKASRNSVVSLSKNLLIPYPIENHVHLLETEIVSSIITDLLAITTNEKTEPQNFEEFLKNQFGETLYNLYFKPYNEKIWKCDLRQVPISWLEGKLPMPTVKEILLFNIKRIKEENFVHSSFYYPIKDGSQFLINRLAEGINIKYNTYVNEITKTETGWNVNGMDAETVIFCGNIKQIPSLLSEQHYISEYRDAINSLEYHGTTTVLCEIDKNPYSWIYLPSKDHESHRIICTGNFSETNNTDGKMTGTIEFTDEISIENIKKNLLQIPLSPKYITHHYEPYTYPIQHKATRSTIKIIKDKLSKDKFYLSGRFADWEYYNMDAAIGAVIDLKENIKQNIQ
jgi:protoporphyrinogen oxidase